MHYKLIPKSGVMRVGFIWLFCQLHLYILSLFFKRDHRYICCMILERYFLVLLKLLIIDILPLVAMWLSVIQTSVNCA